MEEALEGLLKDEKTGSGPHPVYISSLIGSALDFDAASFDKTFNSCILKFGFSATVEEILYPLLIKVGVLWQQEKVHPGQEHFLSNIARQKLFTAIDGIAIPQKPRKRFLLFLPEFEDHEIGLLYSYYLLVKAGISAIYLGQRLPIESLKATVETIQPTHLFFFLITQRSPLQTNSYLQNLANAFPNQEILVSGSEKFLTKLKFPRNITHVADPEQFKRMFKL